MAAAVLSRRAEKDLHAAARWIAKDNPTAARGLSSAVLAAAERIGAHPHIGVIRADVTSRPYRFVNLTGYPYVILYNPEISPPLILRVLHGARDIPSILGMR